VIGKDEMANTDSRMLESDYSANRLEDARLYDGVRTRRVFAFLIDYLIVGILLIPVAIIVFLLGILTLGLGWMLFGVIGPVVALIYVWMTLGGPRQATKGMQWMGIRLERLDGGRIDGMLAVVHSVLFWAGNVILTPFILLVMLIADRKRALHDLLLGTVVIRTDR
jgi:uncharacterized RDD family membrane protein YckC